MRSKKSFVAPPPIQVTTRPKIQLLIHASPLVISLPEHYKNYRRLDLTPWLGKGIDAWVYAVADQLRAFLAGNSVTTSTVVNYWQRGLRIFFEYLLAIRGPAEPTHLEPRHVRVYLGWLSEQDWSYVTQKTFYNNVKSVLQALARRAIVPKQEGLFPPNPFPNSHSRYKGQLPLSSGERERVAHALRDDLVAIHKGTFDGPSSHALVVHLLSVAIRCGANPTPLLEATRDCLHPHPFMPNMMRIELFKRRGYATKTMQLQHSEQNEQSISIPMDGVAVIKKMLETTQPLLAEAKLEDRNRLWLYRVEARNPSIYGKVVSLREHVVFSGIAALVARHDLKGDDGESLRLNLSRLRKTLEHRLFDLSGGDLITTAALMGHGPRVADVHYLACTQAMRENASFLGEVLPDIYREGKATPLLPDKTPSGRCKDPYTGEMAPNNGDACDDFFSCFMCRSYAITGSPDDLHRLFSFYYFLEREIHQAKTEAWRTQFRETMLLIDRFSADKFDAEAVTAARERARTKPLRFWMSYTLSEATNG